MKKINLDNAAAAPLDPAVLEAMLPFFVEHYGNPSSGHYLGEKPKQALGDAREKVGRLINSARENIIFTASASEANNLAVKGAARANRKKGKHIISTEIEHFSVLNPLKTLAKEGFTTTMLPVDSNGMVSVRDLEEAITDQTILVSIQTANPEIGTIQPIKELAAVASKKGILFHTDAVAAAGWIPLDVEQSGVDLLTLTGDQFSGPKGAAALYLRRGVRLAPLIEGGIQERGLRAGTENVPAIVGLGEAARLAKEDLEERAVKVAAVRDELKKELLAGIPNLYLNGHPEKRLPQNLNLSVRFVEGEALLMRLNMAGIFVSSGSSCTSQALKSSHVLKAIGLPPELAQGSLLIVPGKESSVEDVPYVVEQFGRVTELLRNMSPLYHRFLKEEKNNAPVR